MLLDVSQPEALAPGHRGYQTVRTVRLLHAVIRARLTLTPPPRRADSSGQIWDDQSLGLPINQEDLLGTLLSFTTVVFRAFARMGITLDAHAQESYLALWAAIGDLLGLESPECVLRPSDAEALTDIIGVRLHHSSPAGRHLMDVLMGEMEISMPIGLRKLPSNARPAHQWGRPRRHALGRAQCMVGKAFSGSGRHEPPHIALPTRADHPSGPLTPARPLDDSHVDRPEHPRRRIHPGSYRLPDARPPRPSHRSGATRRRVSGTSAGPPSFGPNAPASTSFGHLESVLTVVTRTFTSGAPAGRRTPARRFDTPWTCRTMPGPYRSPCRSPTWRWQ